MQEHQLITMTITRVVNNSTQSFEMDVPVWVFNHIKGLDDMVGELQDELNDIDQEVQYLKLLFPCFDGIRLN